MIFLWKSCTKRDSQTARQAATSAERHALIIAPCPSNFNCQSKVPSLNVHEIEVVHERPGAQVVQK